MKNRELLGYLLPIYLAVIILIQIKISTINIALALAPTILLMISIYYKNKKLGLISFIFFLASSIYLIKIQNMNDYFLVFLEIIFLVIPSVFLLLNQILQLENKKKIILTFNRKAIITSIIPIILIFTVFYVLSFYSFEGFLLSTDSISGQILILSGLASIICIPLIVFSNNK